MISTGLNGTTHCVVIASFLGVMVVNYFISQISLLGVTANTVVVERQESSFHLKYIFVFFIL